MFKYLLTAIVFFCLGASTTILTGFIVFYQEEGADEPLPLTPEAMKSDAECPNYGVDDLLGRWRGSKSLDDDRHQNWTVERRSDGTTTIEFEINGPNGIETFIETGLWAYSGCLYTVVIQSIDERPVLYQEVYLLQELDEHTMVYTNFRTGNTFSVHRKPDS